MKLKLAIFLSLLASVSFSSFAIKKHENQVMYKYIDAQGMSVISNTLPPEAANTGYTILNAQGYEQEKVPPKVNDETLKKIVEQKKIEAAQALEQEKQTKETESLLKMFNSVEDIKQSKQDQTNSIEVLEKITLETIKHIEEQLTQAQKRAVAYQAKKQPIPVSLSDAIKKHQQLITKNKLFLKQKQAEKKRIQDQYDLMIQRFLTIKAHPQPTSGALNQ